ncbi:MAG: hypothetical protein BWY43_00487 [candidate division WS2 bacterium ADurb.Bin280]|uniref:Uncharacterized protein n=1 Tax=candidate division WS2 bacterium ADurb.Bin280 TaxID=1852829 RepID=A0A1V5SD25_9BACT|nr:MAG: hypothetical protein BWY43_00487 [candidate division WS2 bacterium ADurb.Bin280]
MAVAEKRKVQHPTFALDYAVLSAMLDAMKLPEDLKESIALIPGLPKPDVSQILARVCSEVGSPSHRILCRSRGLGKEEPLSQYVAFKRIEAADRIILRDNALVITGHHSQWPEYLEIRVKNVGDTGGVDEGVFAVLLATALWRCNHRLIINRCEGD